MKIYILLVFIFLLSIFNIAYCVDEVLYWMVEEDAKVHYQDGSVQYMPMLVPESTDSSLAARIRVTGKNLLEDTFLNLYVGGGEVWDASMGIDFGDNGSGYWGCGVPTGNQSPITDFNSPEFHFMIELGNYSYDEKSDTESWITVAGSATLSYTALNDYIYHTFDISPPTTGIWSPKDFYVHPVPEPNSGIMFLIGFIILGLKRHNKFII